MYSTIQYAICNIQMQIGSATQKWMGLFTPIENQAQMWSSV